MKIRNSQQEEESNRDYKLQKTPTAESSKSMKTYYGLCKTKIQNSKEEENYKIKSIFTENPKLTRKPTDIYTQNVILKPTKHKF